MAEQKALVDKILAGDQHAFRTLVERYQRLVSHIVFRMIKTDSDREDICQDVFIKIYRNLSNFRFDARLSTWIARIAYNTCLNFLERKKVPLYDDLGDENHDFEPIADERSRPDHNLAKKEISGILQNEIDRLNPVYKTVVTLYHVDQMSYAEIADVMKMPEGTIKSHLFRARRMLKERLLATYQREEL